MEIEFRKNNVAMVVARIPWNTVQLRNFKKYESIGISLDRSLFFTYYYLFIIFNPWKYFLDGQVDGWFLWSIRCIGSHKSSPYTLKITLNSYSLFSLSFVNNLFHIRTNNMLLFVINNSYLSIEFPLKIYGLSWLIANR